jgi:hypothetical protein
MQLQLQGVSAEPFMMPNPGTAGSISHLIAVRRSQNILQNRAFHLVAQRTREGYPVSANSCVI